MLACALLGAALHLAARTGSPWSLVVPLPQQQALILWVQPCGPQRIGGVALRHSDNSRRNRFVNGTLQTLAQMQFARPCP